MSKNIAIGLMLAAFAAGVVIAQQDGLLQPQMEPTGGWTASGTMGKPGGWTATTVAAGVAQKPLAGKEATVTGEIIDLSCYLQLGKHGAAHASCGSKCIASGELSGLSRRPAMFTWRWRKSMISGGMGKLRFAKLRRIISLRS